MLTRFTLLGILARTVFAQEYGETGPDNSTTPTVLEGEIIVHIIQVGKETNEFTPNSILANVGDKVMFQFHEGNHSVIQSLYGWPCIPRETIDGTPGFFSDFYPEVDPNNPPTWNLTIADSSPIWYYCGAPGSCVNWGMLGVINPTNDTNLTAQIEIARQSKIMIEPNQTFPAEEAASVSSLAYQILTPQNEDKGSGGGLSGGAIAGIAVGAVFGAAVIGAVLFFFMRRRRASKKKLDDRQVGNSPAMQNINTGGFLPPYQPFNIPQESKHRILERQSVVSQQSHFNMSPQTLAPGQAPTPMRVHRVVSGELDGGLTTYEMPELAGSLEVPEHERTGTETQVRIID